MNNPLDLFAWKLRAERKRQHLTQKALAERLHMSVRTIIEIEKCKSNPKFETVALLAKELNISLDAAIFPDMVTGTVSRQSLISLRGKVRRRSRSISHSANRRRPSKKTNNAVGFDVPDRVTIFTHLHAGKLIFYVKSS